MQNVKIRENPKASKYLETQVEVLGMWCYRRMLETKSVDKVTDERVLEIMGEIIYARGALYIDNVYLKQ